MFIPTYIIGWKIAEDSYNWKTTELSGCLLLPASTKHYETFEYCTEFHIPEYMMTHHTKNHQEFAPEIWNYFLKNDYNIFSNKEFNESALNDAYDFTQRWNNSSNMSAIDVEFERINFNELESYSVVPKITGPQISLEGVIRSASNVNFNDLFLFLNDQPFAKINSVVNTSESTFSWKLVFLSEYVSDGCHEFSLGLIDNSISYRSSQTLEFCK